MAQIAYVRQSLIEVSRLESMLEMNGDARLPSGDVEQALVEPQPRDRVDEFVGPLPVGLQRGASLRMLNEPTAHRQKPRFELPDHSRRLQGVNATIRQGQIDGSARVIGSVPRVGSALVYFHRVAAAPQQDGEQRAGGAGADDANRGTIHAHPRTA